MTPIVPTHGTIATIALPPTKLQIIKPLYLAQYRAIIERTTKHKRKAQGFINVDPAPKPRTFTIDPMGVYSIPSIE